MRYLTFLLTFFISNFSFAEDIQLRDSNHCERYFSYFEQMHQIPKGLLKAISLVETKLWHGPSKNYITWPWAVNAAGKSFHFESKKEAIAAINEMRKKGQKSFDVSCMQVNLYYHPKAFSSLEQAFEPRYNINYAANFLKNNFEKHRSWKKAIAAYHSENPIHGTPYASKVINHWRNLSNTKVEYASQTHSYVPVKNQKRLRSNMVIQVNAPPIHNPRSHMVESITQNALNEFSK